MKTLRKFGWWLAVLGIASPATVAQIADQVVVYGESPANFLRFDRRLTLLGDTMVVPWPGSLEWSTPLAIDALGRAWIAFTPLGVETLARVGPDGALLPSVQLATNPVAVEASQDGRVYALTRIPLSSPGPAYGVSADGTVLWSNAEGPDQDTLSYPQHLTMTAGGALWMGDTTPWQGSFFAHTVLWHLSTTDGSVLDTSVLPDLTGNMGDEVLAQLAGAPDGTMWLTRGGPKDPPGSSFLMQHTDGHSILQSFPLFDAGIDGQTAALRVDGASKLYVVSANSTAGSDGKLLVRYDPTSPSAPEAKYTMGGLIVGFALGANGDEAYAVIAPESAPLTRRLERVSLVTGRKSSTSLDAWFNATIAYGDPTGFIFANVIDRSGDNDGDGIANGDETAARSNPFDPLSHPDGPKVFIDFAPTTNAPVISYQDPDGLLDPQKGLDLSTLSLKVGNYGEVFSFLLPFLTAVSVSPDGTQATATFGALHLASNAKLRFEARVADRTGAEGWDFQVSPPGDL